MSEREPKKDNRPIMHWDSEEISAKGCVWWAKLDDRFQVEVQRDEGGDGYAGTLCIFDHADEDKLLLSEPVALSYGARFGADVNDVRQWQEKVLEFVDSMASD